MTNPSTGKEGGAARRRRSRHRRYRVVVIEWLSHEAVIEAENAKAAEAEARRLWDTQSEHEVFRFEDSGIDGVLVDELEKGGAQ